MRRSLKSLSLGLALGAVAPSAIAAETKALTAKVKPKFLHTFQLKNFCIV